MRHQFARCKTSMGASALLVTLCIVGLSVPASAQSRRYSGRGITVYADPDFRGASTTIREDTPDLRGFGLNDKISSIEVPNGEAWEICQDINYGNRCQVITGSVSDLRGMGWNDRISSLRRVANRNGNGLGTGATTIEILALNRCCSTTGRDSAALPLSSPATPQISAMSAVLLPALKSAAARGSSAISPAVVPPSARAYPTCRSSGSETGCGRPTSSTTVTTTGTGTEMDTDAPGAVAESGGYWP